MQRTKLILALGLLLASAGASAVTGTLSANTSGTETFISLGRAEGTLILAGTFGGGTVKLQLRRADGTGAADIPGATWTAPTVYAIDLGAEGFVRLQLSGATGPSIAWEIIPKTTE